MSEAEPGVVACLATKFAEVGFIFIRRLVFGAGGAKLLAPKAMDRKGISKGIGQRPLKEKILLTCGASAGLAAAFHAPLADVMFSLGRFIRIFLYLCLYL